MIRLPERALEDWVCENIARLYPVEPEHAAVLRRQWRLPSGRVADVLSTALFGSAPRRQLISVVELKATPVDEAAVVQLLGYGGEVRAACEAINRARREAGSLERRLAVEYVLAGAGVTPRARWCIEALRPLVRFVKLSVQVSADAQVRCEPYSLRLFQQVLFESLEHSHPASRWPAGASDQRAVEAVGANGGRPG